MQNMSDNELDNLFKEAAEGFTPPQDESAWKQMADRLDQHAVNTTGFWNWKTISAVTATAVIAITSVWFVVGDQEKISKTQDKNESTNATQGVVQEQKEQAHSTGNQNLASAKSLEDKSNGTRTLSSAEPKKENTQVTRTQPSSKRNDHNGTPSINDRDGKPSDGSESIMPIAAASTVQTSSAVQSEDRSSAPQVINKDKVLVTGDSIKAVIRQDSLAHVTANSTDTPNKKDDAANVRGVWSIKAVVSPDYSSINFFSAGKTGFNYGLLAGYSFNNRWSVYTGVISSKKLYNTDEVEGSYNWNGHDYPVKELDGDCRILDIPINVYYTFFPERSLSLRAGLGFSSYIMREETYVFCVDNYGTDAYYAQQVIGKNNEWFKILNLSVAVSKKIANRWSAEFEPFVKAPLAGVGEGKVSLVSMGAFINLKFELTKNK